MATISRYTEVNIETSPGVITNFKLRSEYYGYDREWQGQNDIIISAASVNGKLSGSAKPIDRQITAAESFSEPAASEISAILRQQKTEILAEVSALPADDPQRAPVVVEEAEVEADSVDDASTGENAQTDDQQVSGGSNPAGSDPNAAQQAKLDETQGTEQTTSPNIDGGGNAQSNPNTSSADAPGRRLKNPLGSLSSYTYQISLYMITPDAYDAFQASGRRQISALEDEIGQGSGGAYLIAQSGGVNNNTSQRAPGFEWDYYIDNLKLKQAISGKSTNSSTNMYEVSFDILEPYGFSFNTKLRQASDALQQYSNDAGYSGTGKIDNPTRQFFVLGVKFNGYDNDGNLANGALEFENSGPIDPNASGNSLFQVYYDINITSIKFTIDGGATRYACTGVAVAPGKAFGTKRGRTFSTTTVIGATFDEALQGGKDDIGGKGLFTQINTFEQWKVDNKIQEFANIHRVEYIGEDVEAIKDARLILPTDTDKSKWTSGDIENTQESNDATAAKAVPDDSKRKINFNADTTYIEIFDEILKGSSYMYDALKIVYMSQASPSKQDKEQPSLDPNSAKKIAWYKVTPVLSAPKWDSIISDWAYTMTYRIETYKTPVITSIGTNAGEEYYGPHKRYEYWWTGENREVLSYEQKLDNLFYNEVLGSSNELNEDGVGTGGSTQVPVAPNQNASGAPRMNAIGGGRASQNQYVTSLYSPDSYAQAKIRILGDPDFLVQDYRGGPDAVYNRFYGEDGYRISANGGQVFIEVDFKEAVDYNDETGVMDINDSILFYKYPAWAEEKIKGVSYQVITAVSTFESGSFQQELTAVINTFADSDAEAPGENQREESESTNPNRAGQEGTMSSGNMTTEDQTANQNLSEVTDSGGQSATEAGNPPTTESGNNDDAGG